MPQSTAKRNVLPYALGSILTAEILLQVCEHLQRIGKVCGVWAIPIVGGISPIKQERLLRKFPEVRKLLLFIF